ncbi:hypothetical protein GH714_030127 [Hevea brasiliensis]|uniref:Remorin C-terminal domain-containing protein n=1 Tax=Hevea brasiliensis TaxID=3981 RepID=A0A6A6L3Y9_HEVBR|nr:hypothetical protein GH714_030127 [Hevea brasiliensis]
MTTSFRVRFAGQQGVAGPGSSKERRIPSQKTLSFKEEKKRPQNWFRRQISWQMNQDYDLDGIDRATAVAAAACAISSLEEFSIPEQKQISKATQPSFTRSKTKKEGQDSMRISEIPDEKTPAKVVGPTPSMKRTPTFTEKPAVPMKKIPTFAEEQYEELEARILSWEHKKKAKSRRRLDRIESELEKKRLKALQQFRSEGDDINEIAGGARSKAMESKRNEELKVKEKANKIGVTGRVPRTCFCF